jgi:tRNA-(ms[2]io[6]A)-hydroxylase
MSLPLRPSSDAWVAAALDDLETLLVDHAHCERKAAATALKLIARYGDRPRIVHELSRLAREELVHFERVVAHLEKRGSQLRALPSAGYAAALLDLVDPSERLRDELLVCALIEARSCERFVRLASAAAERAPELAAFYAELAQAEARHESLYVELAQTETAHDARAISARLAELARLEGEIVHRPAQPLRMHAGG